MTHSDLNLWCQSHFYEHLELLKTLAVIPAPSHQEDRRTAFIKDWLQQQGFHDVIIDPSKNVILTLGRCDIPCLCVMAHTDVVFPDTDPLPLTEENGRLYAPGVGDDTANVATLMMCAKFFGEHPDLIPEPLLLVFNSCEEGLGNLKGVRQIMADYGQRIHSLVSFDCQSNAVICRAVGSERWNVSVATKGGHSFSDFGNANAIARLSSFVANLYKQTVPQKPDCKTTYNVGLISGGTSVNTIAQQAEVTYEYRSNDRECLAFMRQKFLELVDEANCEDAAFTVTSLGVRPCDGDVPEDRRKALVARCKSAIQTVYDIDPPLCAASTDANIPLSLGIPAATFGLYRGGGAHTREEYVEISSLTPGLLIALNFFLYNSEQNC